MPPAAKPKAKVSSTGVPIQLLTAADVAPTLKMGVYGRSGAGKTQLAATACEVEELSPVCYLDCGSSSDTILGEKRFSSLKDVYRLRTLDDLTAMFNWLAPEEWGGEGNINNYRTLVIDEFDELHTQTMRKVMEFAVKLNPNQDPYVPSPREWGIMRSKMLEIVDWIGVLPVNLIWLCTPNIKEDQYTLRDQLTLGLPGKLSDDVSKRLSIIAYMEVITKRLRENGENVDKTQRLLHFAPTGKYLTKVRGASRAERLGDNIENPTMSEIWRRWNS